MADETMALVEQYPGLPLFDLTASLARRAAQIASAHRLRGADSVYVAVAEATSATLITWDVEMLARGADVVSVLTPLEWINRTALQEH